MFVKTLPSRQGFCVCVIGQRSGSRIPDAGYADGDVSHDGWERIEAV